MLRPRFYLVPLMGRERRFIFALERPNRTRAFFAAATFYDREYGNGEFRTRGAELEIKVFG